MRERLLPILGIAAILACCIFSRSCANTTTPPSGGPKDTIPPVLISVMPENGTTNFPRFGQKITLLFNEYTVVKDQSGIIMSPPHRKRPQAKVKGKGIIVSFQDSLRADQTYTIDFGEALVDNNEGNKAPRLVYAFSTGSTIDSMYLTGSVLDSKTLKPVKNALVTIYSDLSDSACFIKQPDAATRSDDWGFFVIRNIKKIPYRIYAYSDNDGDFMYNPNGDDIAFYDTEFIPDQAVNDSIYELGLFNVRDTAACKKRHPMVTLSMFKELQTAQYLQNSVRTTEKSGYLKFSAADVKINSLDFFEIDKEQVILQYNKTRDSIDFWINSKYRLSDSLLITLDYMKTDSTGVLAPAVENLSLAVKEKNEPLKDGEKKPAKDTVFKLKISVADEVVESEGVTLDSEWPLIDIQLDSIQFIETNPKGKKFNKKFTLQQDTIEVRRYHLIPDDVLVKGHDYEFIMPQGTFKDLMYLPNQEAKVKFQIPQDEKLSTLTLEIKNAVTKYILELTDENDNALRTFVTDKDCAITVPYVKAGKYKIRIYRDSNRNGYQDTGNLLAHKQPERVILYGTSPDKPILEIPESVEVTQEIDMEELFK